MNNSGDAFTVTPEATLVLARPLDYETLSEYHMTLIASDHGTPARSSTATIDIRVTDVADNPPLFAEPRYSPMLPESAPIGTPVVSVLASSVDSSDLRGVRYSIVGGDTDTFLINSTTGLLTLQRSLDYELFMEHNLTVFAESTLNSELGTSVPIVVTVGNVNEHAPLFSRVMFEVGVREGADAGVMVTVVSADDADMGEFGVLVYRVIGQEDPPRFSIDPSTGEVLTVGRLNQVQGSEFNFTVEAADGGSPPRTARATLVIHVMGVERAGPVFPMPMYTVDIVEGDEEGDVATVMASSDLPVQYYIQSGDSEQVFAIGEGGVVRSRAGLDRERRGQYRLVIVASDGRWEARATLVVNVGDVNDNPPQFQVSRLSRAVSEGVAAGVELVRLVATDRDTGENGRVTYSLLQPHPLLSVGPESGIITVKEGQSLDYEDPTGRTHSLTVIATDGGDVPLNSSALVMITVLDENDHAPIFSDHTPSTVPIPENQPPQMPLLQVVAVDADSAPNAVVRYSLSGDVRALGSFGVDPRSGRLYSRGSLDRERQDRYQLTLHATDSGATPLSNSASITVEVTDEIDDPPLFARSAYTIHVADQRQPNSSLLTVTASTRDLNASSVQYRIIAGDDSPLFQVGESTGVVSSTIMLEPSTNEAVYRLTLSAAHGSLSTSVPVQVIVRREDQIPRVRSLAIHMSVFPSLLRPVTPLGSVEVIQPLDAITFSLLHSPPSISRYFSITPRTGVISVLDSVPSGHYRLNVSAATSEGVGFGDVSVILNRINNSTLENSVVVEFAAGSEASFIAHHLESFTRFVADLWPVPLEHVEVCGVQASRDGSRRTVELALAVRSHDYHTYIPAGDLQALLLLHASTFIPSFLPVPDACISAPCPNLQVCESLLQLHASSGPAPLATLATPHLRLHSHPFSIARRCRCPLGYSRSTYCSSEINECEPRPCHFGAECTDLVGDYQCSCPSGTLGKNCSILCGSSDDCTPCDPTPCLNGGTCQSMQDVYTCTNCPSPHHTGPHCELNTLHFTPGSYVALQTTPSAAALSVAFSFSTLTSSGLLLYGGRYHPPADYVSVELLVGQVNVGVSFGGVATVLRTESATRLNDGAWHRVDLGIRNRVSRHYRS